MMCRPCLAAIWRENGAGFISRGQSLGQHFAGIANGLHLVKLIIRKRDAKALFQRQPNFNQGERVRAQVFLEPGFSSKLSARNSKGFNQDVLDSFELFVRQCSIHRFLFFIQH